MSIERSSVALDGDVRPPCPRMSLPVLVIVAVIGAASADAYDAAMVSARTALRGGRLDEALGFVDEAVSLAGAPPQREVRAALAQRLAGDVEMRRKRYHVAARRYRAAARTAAGNHRLWRSITGRRRGALRKAKANRGAAQVRQLLANNALVRERARRPAVPKRRIGAEVRKLAGAAALFSADGDHARAAWVRAVSALTRVRSGELDRGGSAARRSLAGRGGDVRYVRLVALEAARWAARKRGELKAETGFALEANALRNMGRDPDIRRYRRTQALVSACRRYDAAEGPGACAALAFARTGEWSFDDTSRRRPKARLEPADIERAQRQFLPALEACIAEAASAPANRDLFEGASMEIEWSIAADGRVHDPSIAPRRYEPVVGDCVRERLSWFRYPRSLDGERPLVSIPYEMGTRGGPVVP